MKLFIDTSIFMDVLRTEQAESSKSLFKSLHEGNEGFTSAITVAELSVGAFRSPRRDALEKTLKLLSVAHVIDFSSSAGQYYPFSCAHTRCRSSEKQDQTVAVLRTASMRDQGTEELGTALKSLGARR